MRDLSAIADHLVKPPFRELGTTYDVHLGLIGKRVVHILK